jgi:hypothetical protein
MEDFIQLSQIMMKINNNRIRTLKYCTVIAIIMITLNKILTFYSNKIKTSLY